MAYEKAEAVREFRRWSAGYDRCILQRVLFGPSHRAILGRILGRAGAPPSSLLDVGCGTGVFAALVRAALPGACVFGVDLVAEMLKPGGTRWRSDDGRLAAVRGDSERLPFPDRSFDVVTCSNSFHHYPRQELAVAEMHRVLKPGGRLLLVDGSRDRAWGWFVYDVCVVAAEGAVRHASARDVRAMFDRAGFGETSQSVYRGPAPFLLTEGVARQLAAPGERDGVCAPAADSEEAVSS